MPFEHKSEYNISIGHSATIKHKIDGAVAAPFRLSFCSFPVFSGSHSGILFKNLTEIPGIIISCHIADFNDLFVGTPKELLNFFHPYFCEIFYKIAACFFLKETAQIVRMKIKLFCQGIQADVFPIVLADEKLDFPDDILTQCLLIGPVQE